MSLTFGALSAAATPSPCARSAHLRAGVDILVRRSRGANRKLRQVAEALVTQAAADNQ